MTQEEAAKLRHNDLIETNIELDGIAKGTRLRVVLPAGSSCWYEGLPLTRIDCVSVDEQIQANIHLEALDRIDTLHKKLFNSGYWDPQLDQQLQDDETGFFRAIDPII